jgi:hypothetical protein
MDQFIQQDIFFFVTTIAVLLVSLLLSILLMYFIKIAHTTNYILKKVKVETDIISGELGELRRNIRKEGVRIKHFTKFFSKVKKGK